jgi:hypothetical protein
MSSVKRSLPKYPAWCETSLEIFLIGAVGFAAFGGVIAPSGAISSKTFSSIAREERGPPKGHKRFSFGNAFTGVTTKMKSSEASAATLWSDHR